MPTWIDSDIIRGIPYKRGQKVDVVETDTLMAYTSADGAGGVKYHKLTYKPTYYFGTVTDANYNIVAPYNLGYTSGAADYFVTADAFPNGTYTVTYDANGGNLNGITRTQTKTYGTRIYVPSTKPTRTGYTFQGWSVPDRDLNYAYYMPGDGIDYNGNQTLKAVWTQNILTVNYYSGGATYGTLQGNEIKNLSDLLGVSEFAYATEEENGLWDIQLKDWLYLEKKNYKPTGYWLYNGKKIDQYWPCTGAELANFLGVDISTSSQSINVIPEWKQTASTVTVYVPQTDGTVKPRSGIVHMYNSSGDLCYGIVTIYDEKGTGRLAI